MFSTERPWLWRGVKDNVIVLIGPAEVSIQNAPSLLWEKGRANKGERERKRDKGGGIEFSGPSSVKFEYFADSYREGKKKERTEAKGFKNESKEKEGKNQSKKFPLKRCIMPCYCIQYTVLEE